jgi:hypothetical protein
LLNYLVHNMPDGTWLSGSAPQGGSQGLSRRGVPDTAISPTTTVTVKAGSSMPEMTPSIVKRQNPLVCTTTITVSPTTTVYSINSLTATYTGLASSASPSPVRQPLISLCSELCSLDLWGIMCSMELCIFWMSPCRSDARVPEQAQLQVTTILCIHVVAINSSFNLGQRTFMTCRAISSQPYHDHQERMGNIVNVNFNAFAN